MPISQADILQLLEAAEDFQQAAQEMHRMVVEADRRVDTGAMPRTTLQELALMADPLMLLKHPVESEMAIRMARRHYSPGRISRNNKRKLEREGG